MRTVTEELTDWQRFKWWATPHSSRSLNCVETQDRDLRFPPAKIFEDEEGYFLIADMPFCDAESLEFRSENRTVILSGYCDESLLLSEAFFSHAPMPKQHFTKSFLLPGPVVVKAIDIRFQNGFLFAWIPKYVPNISNADSESSSLSMPFASELQVQ